MPTEPYGRMELLRLSPRDGKELTRLNIMQGQILHGRVYKMEPYGPVADETADTGGVAKIALGSHLIEAVVSKSLPEGAQVTLQVLRITEDSFVLHLLSVEEPKVHAQDAHATVERDQIDLSAEVLDKMGAATQRLQTARAPADFSRIVESLDWAALPKPLAQAVRAAISAGFIEPGDLTANVPAMRVVLHQALEDFQNAVDNLPASVPEATRELAEAIDSLTALLRPMIASLPPTGIAVDESVAAIARALEDVAGMLRPTGGQISQPSVAAEPAGSVLPQAGGPTVDTAVLSAPASAETSDALPAAARADAAPPAGTGESAAARPGAPQQQTDSAGVTPGGSSGKSPPSAQLVSQAQLDALPSAAGEKSTGTFQTITSEGFARDRGQAAPAPSLERATGEEALAARAHPARFLLLGMRTLARLADEFALSRGLTVEQSGDLRAHAGRITSLADALEGTIIAPLLARPSDAGDLIARILLPLLFPGGYVHLGVLQPADEGGESRGEAPQEDTGDEGKTVGVIRIRTEALGTVRIRMDYREADEAARVSGQFVARRPTADAIRESLSSLVGALDARGVKSEGFRITALKTDDEEKPPPPSRAGGLDLKV